MKTQELQKEITPIRQELIEHDLYKNIDSIESIRVFMEAHVFAVWDFMSLLKALQNGLTNTNIPWTPKGNHVSRRLINEIVLGEESDLNEIGEPMSHFEMYLDSMEQLGASTEKIRTFIELINNTIPLEKALKQIDLDETIQNFVKFTFEKINSKKLNVIAAVFTFGREDLIPDMFIEIVKNIENNSDINMSKLIYYLERHIEVDSGEHGPMALKMIEELCGQDELKWKEAFVSSQESLQQRIALWNGINNQIKSQIVSN